MPANPQRSLLRPEAISQCRCALNLCSKGSEPHWLGSWPDPPSNDPPSQPRSRRCQPQRRANGADAAHGRPRGSRLCLFAAAWAERRQAEGLAASWRDARGSRPGGRRRRDETWSTAYDRLTALATRGARAGIARPPPPMGRFSQTAGAEEVRRDAPSNQFGARRSPALAARSTPHAHKLAPVHKLATSPPRAKHRSTCASDAKTAAPSFGLGGHLPRAPLRLRFAGARGPGRPRGLSRAVCGQDLAAAGPSARGAGRGGRAPGRRAQCPGSRLAPAPRGPKVPRGRARALFVSFAALLPQGPPGALEPPRAPQAPAHGGTERDWESKDLSRRENASCARAPGKITNMLGAKKSSDAKRLGANRPGGRKRRGAGGA